MSLARIRRFARLAVLVLGWFTLFKWQWAFTSPSVDIDQTYKQTAATGINMEAQFVFYLHHLGLFPVATDAPIKADTKEEALRLLHDEPAKIKQDHGSTFRAGGDRGRIYLYLVDVYLKHKSVSPKLVPAHALAFTFALCCLFTAFWSVRKTIAGFLLCLLLGSDPFQLFVVYRQENVFSWPITAMTLLLAINLPLMVGKTRWKWYPLAAAITTGFAMAVVRTFRSEPTPLLLSVLIVYVTAVGLSKLSKVKLVAALGITFTLSSMATVKFLDRKLEHSKALVRSMGGSEYTGPVVHNHLFWHPVFCGFGDFDKKYGYAWDDRVAYKYALPFLKASHPELPLSAYGAVQSWSYDKAGKYPVLFEEVGNYNDLIRDKVIHDVTKDPKWFFGILKQRVWRILTETTPLSLTYKGERLTLGGPMLGVLCVPLAVFLAFSRRWFLLKLLFFSTPISIGALMIYSGHGMTYYGTFHVFGAFIFGVLAAEGGSAMWKNRFARG